MNLELNISTEHNSKLPVFQSVHNKLECIFKTLKKQQNASAHCIQNIYWRLIKYLASVKKIMKIHFI